jgi:hypothetical protein
MQIRPRPLDRLRNPDECLLELGRERRGEGAIARVLADDPLSPCNRRPKALSSRGPA